MIEIMGNINIYKDNILVKHDNVRTKKKLKESVMYLQTQWRSGHGDHHIRCGSLDLVNYRIETHQPHFQV